MVDSIFALVSVAAVALAFFALLRYGVGMVAGGRGRSQRVRLPRSYGRRMRGGRGLLGWGLILVAKAMIIALRFAVGLPLSGVRRTDATLFHAGTAVTNNSGSWLTRGPTWWSFLPYWQRAAARWAAVVAVVAYIKWPVPTVVVGALTLATFAYVAGRRWLARFRLRRHHRELVRPLYGALASYLGLGEDERADDWVEVPTDWQTNRSAVVTLHYPEAWDPTDLRMKRIEAVMTRFLGADWDAHWDTYSASWRRAPTPPRRVELAEIEQRAPADPFVIPVGVQARDTLGLVDMRSESPHWFVTAPPGGGKTSVLRIPVARTRPHGWLVDIIDFKQNSFVELEGVPGVRIHTDVESAVYALSEFYVSMKGAQAAIKAGRMAPDEVTPRLLVIDEFGSMMTLLKSWWLRHKQETKKKGEPPFLDAFLIIGYQGREGSHRMVVGVHNADAKHFRGTDGRDLFTYRALVGAAMRWKWRKTFESAPRIEYDASIPGRGVLGAGEHNIHEIQYAWVSQEENRARCLAAPAPPEWFEQFALAPWVTPEVLAQAANEVGIEIVSPAGTHHTSPDQTRGDVPPTAPDTSPSPRPTGPVPSPRPAEPAAGRGKAPENAPETAAAHAFGGTFGSGQAPPDTVGEETVTVPTLQVVRRDQEPWIVGYQAAANYLTSAGWEMTAETFKRTRNREKEKGNVIHGESRTDDGKPCWKPSELRAWQARRKIAGRRQFGQAGNQP